MYRNPELQFVLAFSVKQPVSLGIIRFRYEHLRQPVQITVVGQGGVHKLLRGGDAVLLQHGYQHLGIDDGAGVEKFHTKDLVTGGTQMKHGFQGRARRFVATPVSPRAFCKPEELNCFTLASAIKTFP